MDYITIKEAAEKWELSVRRVQELCKQGAVAGATLWGRTWMIPINTDRPQRKSKTENKFTEEKLPRKTANLCMSTLYRTPGTAEKVTESLGNYPGSALLFRAQLNYMRGNFSAAQNLLKQLMTDNTGFYTRTGAGFLMCRCAIWKSDINLWNYAKKYMLTTPVKSKSQSMHLDFWSYAADTALHDISAVPEWFKNGKFEILPMDTYPSARFYYLKYFYIKGTDSFKNQEEGNTDDNTFSFLPALAEPLIAQSYTEGALLSELYQRLLIAFVYHATGDENAAIAHIDRAIEIAIPDRLLVPLAENCRSLDNLIYDRLSLVAPELTPTLKNLFKKLMSGWIPLHNAVLNHNISVTLSARERQVARLAVFGLSNKEISERLHISVNTVKQLIYHAMNKTGAENRKELGLYI